MSNSRALSHGPRGSMAAPNLKEGRGRPGIGQVRQRLDGRHTQVAVATLQDADEERYCLWVADLTDDFGQPPARRPLMRLHPLDNWRNGCGTERGERLLVRHGLDIRPGQDGLHQGLDSRCFDSNNRAAPGPSYRTHGPSPTPADAGSQPWTSSVLRKTRSHRGVRPTGTNAPCPWGAGGLRRIDPA